MDSFIIAQNGLRMFRRRIRVGLQGIKHYNGTPEQILQRIIEDCWDTKHHYFRVSSGHFCEFYIRDFGLCCHALIMLGHKERVRKTLLYALSCYTQENRITTSISKQGQVYDFPYPAADSLPFLIHSLYLLNDSSLLKQHASFLDTQVSHFYNTVLDTQTGLVRSDTYYSSIKDYARRKSSCYDNCMVGMLAHDLRELPFLHNPFYSYDYPSLITSLFWNGAFFYEDTERKKIVTGDSQVFPFWTGMITDKKKFFNCQKALHESHLDIPFPLKYSSEKMYGDQIFLSSLAGDYERNTLWLHLGMAYLEVLSRHDKKLFLSTRKTYYQLIKQEKNFLEVYTPFGKPFSTPFYYSDESMLWGCVLLSLL